MLVDMKNFAHLVSQSLLLAGGLAVGLVASAASPAESEKVAAQLRDQASAGKSIAYNLVSDLTTRFGPRPAGSASEQQSAKWLANEFQKMGFSNVAVEEFPLTSWSRGQESAEIISPSPQKLAAAALGGSPPTPAAGLEGEVVLFRSLDELLAAPEGSLTGKIAMVSRRMVSTQDGSGYGVAVAARSRGPSEAQKRGAIAFLLRSLGTDSARMPHVGASAYIGGRTTVPSFAVSTPDADQLERLVALGQPVKVRVFSSAKLDPNAHSQNVIAEVRGSEAPDEVVLLGAHLDSWDQGTGAIDDAAGVAIIAAAAKLIQDQPRKPRRTIRIVAFGSEEVSQPKPPFGVFGGHAYANKRLGMLEKHIIAGESDFGADRIYGLQLPKGAAESEWAKALYRVLDPAGVLPAAGDPGHGGADVGPTVARGVPAFLLQQDGTRYFDLHHTADDTLDKIDRKQLEQNVAAWVALTWLIADSDVDFRKLAAAAAAAPADAH